MFLSTNCVKYRGKDEACKGCPVAEAGYCHDFCEALPRIAGKFRLVRMEDGRPGPGRPDRGYDGDAAFDIYTKVLEDLEKSIIDKFEGKCRLHTWMTEIVKNKVKDYIKRDRRDKKTGSPDDDDDSIRSRFVPLEENDDWKTYNRSETPGPEEGIMDGELGRVIAICMKRLQATHPGHASLIDDILKLLREDEADRHTPDFSRGRGVNMSKILARIARDRGKTPESLRRKFNRWLADIRPRLGRCLAEHGYGGLCN